MVPSTPPPERYPYRTLSLPTETRILTITPGTFDDELICSLSHMPLPIPKPTNNDADDFTEEEYSPTRFDELPYEALSYCWSHSILTKDGRETDPETQVMTYLYGRDEDGNLVDKTAHVPFKDLLDDPYQGRNYIRRGGRLPDGVIVCDGVRMVVGGELNRALCRLRYEEDSLRIWVDALCINQNDVEERNEHVKMMGRVYQGAERVRVWLGEESGIEDGALRMLSIAGQRLASLLGRGGMGADRPSLAHIQREFFKVEDDEEGMSMSALDWDALADLLRRAWFERTWVVQEFANAKSATFQIGQIEVPWELLAYTVFLLRLYRLDAMIASCTGIKSLCMMYKLREERVGDGQEHSRMSLLDLLEELRDFKSTIASDKIYGIIGLTDEKDKITVDYSKSPEQVFTEFAVSNLVSGSLDILSHCIESSPNPRVLNLPSWIPDWSRPGWVEPFRIRDLQANACGNMSQPIFTIDHDFKTLQIKGRLLDIIAAVETQQAIPIIHVSDIPPPPPNHLNTNIDDEDDEPDTPNMMDPRNLLHYRLKQYHSAHIQVHQSMISIAFPDQTPATPETWEAFWRTFMCNRTRENKIPDQSCKEGFDLYFAAQVQGGVGIVLDEKVDHFRTEHGLREDEVEYFREENRKVYEVVSEAHGKWCRHRRFVTSEGGRFGWVLDGTEVGDVVGMFYGGRHLFVLREVDGGEGGEKKYRIVGDCYLHGFMEGEGVEEGSGYLEMEFMLV